MRSRDISRHPHGVETHSRRIHTITSARNISSSLIISTVIRHPSLCSRSSVTTREVPAHSIGEHRMYGARFARYPSHCTFPDTEWGGAVPITQPDEIPHSGRGTACLSEARQPHRCRGSPIESCYHSPDLTLAHTRTRHITDL